MSDMAAVSTATTTLGIATTTNTTTDNGTGAKRKVILVKRNKKVRSEKPTDFKPKAGPSDTGSRTPRHGAWSPIASPYESKDLEEEESEDEDFDAISSPALFGHKGPRPSTSKT